MSERSYHGATSRSPSGWRIICWYSILKGTRLTSLSRCCVRSSGPCRSNMKLCCRACAHCVRSLCDGSADRTFLVDPLSYFSFQLVFHDWSNKVSGMYYPICWLVHVKYPLLIITKRSSYSGGSRFPLLLSQ